MSNKQYRLQRLQQGTKFKQAEAKVKSSEAKIAEAKQKLAGYKSQDKTNKATKLLAQQIRDQEARKKSQGSTFKKVASAVKFKPQLSKNLLSYANAFTGGSNSQGRTQSGPGRPKGVMKWRSPFTGKPIPAPEYYKQVRAYRRIQEQKAEQSQAQQLQALAKKGMSPQQVAMIQLRQQQMVQQQNIPQMQSQQVQQVSQMPEQMQNVQPSGAVRPIWRRQSVVAYETDVMGNRRPILRGNDPRSFWN